MHRGIWLVAAVLLATAASAADQNKNDPRAKATAAEGPREKLKKKRDAAKGAAAPPAAQDKGKAASAPRASESDRAAALRAKSVYMFAVEACERPDRCDAVLRDDAEKRFMDACLACATQDLCDAERSSIQGGSARRSKDPCTP